MTKGIKRKINKVEREVSNEISTLAREGGKFAAGLSGEGYAGGYRDALNDVILALNGVTPDRRGWWRKKK